MKEEEEKRQKEEQEQREREEREKLEAEEKEFLEVERKEFIEKRDNLIGIVENYLTKQKEEYEVSREDDRHASLLSRVNNQ